MPIKEEVTCNGRPTLPMSRVTSVTPMVNFFIQKRILRVRCMKRQDIFTPCGKNKKTAAGNLFGINPMLPLLRPHRASFS